MTRTLPILVPACHHLEAATFNKSRCNTWVMKRVETRSPWSGVSLTDVVMHQNGLYRHFGTLIRVRGDRSSGYGAPPDNVQVVSFYRKSRTIMVPRMRMILTALEVVPKLLVKQWATCFLIFLERSWILAPDKRRPIPICAYTRQALLTFSMWIPKFSLQFTAGSLSHAICADMNELGESCSTSHLFIRR
jgi:hypothetical protein